MKRSNILFSALLLAGLFLTASCREVEKIDPNTVIPGLGGTEEVANELDGWLETNFRAPYNIDVVYRWDAAQMYTSLSGVQLVPAKYDAVKPMMAAMRDVWFEPYVQAGDGTQPHFLQETAPKKIVLVGSPEYQDGGSIKLGQAEGGRKILLLNVNAFDAKELPGLQMALQTIEHEYAHILHQTKMFDKEYATISSKYYDPAGWQNYTDEEAYDMGLVSAYSLSGKDEDFAEVLSMIIVNGYDWFENTVLVAAAKSTKNPNAKNDLMRKVEIIQKYMKESWGVRYLDSEEGKGLESYVQEAIQKVSTTPPTE